MATATHRAIPHPPRWPLIGNLPQILGGDIFGRLAGLAERYGPIYELTLSKGPSVFVSSQALVNEVCDDGRFIKSLSPGLIELRKIGGDGLFTAWSDEANWKKAHNILVPAFSLSGMRRYFPTMLETADELIEAWERAGSSSVDVSADMTRLTFETIGRCGFGVGFDSFSGQTQHPFIVAMNRALSLALTAVIRPPIVNAFFFGERRQLAADIAVMNATVDGVIARRRAGEEAKREDLLSLMLHAVDPESGEGLDDINIRYQALTFLIAGHETTSGLLSFALYYLARQPEVAERIRAEVAEVLGERAPEYEDIARLRYTQQALKEALRLWPTAPAFSREPTEDTAIGEGYRLAKGKRIMVLLPALHRDPRVWGPDPERFDPERFSPEEERARPANAYKPFGHGKRACIGKNFAMIEATLALALILRRFDIEGDPGYRLKTSVTITLKPDGFFLKLRQRR